MSRVAIRVAILLRKRSLGHGPPIRHRQAKIGKNRFERNRRVVLAPCIGFSDGGAVFFGERLIGDQGQREFGRVSSAASWMGGS